MGIVSMIKGHGEKLTRKRDAAIVALLAAPTIAAAAQQAGIGERTLRTWLKLPEFQKAYRRARRDAFEQSAAMLQQLAGDAIDALRRNLTCDKPAVEVSAALAILDRTGKAIEQLDLAAELDELRQQLEEMKDEHGNPAAASSPASAEGGTIPAGTVADPGSDPPRPGGDDDHVGHAAGSLAGISAPLAGVAAATALFSAGR